MAKDVFLFIRDPGKYAKVLVESGEKIIRAVKVGAVIVRPAKSGEMIDVWTKDGNLEATEAQ